MERMKAMLTSRVMWRTLGLLLAAVLLASCNTNQPRREESSPFAPQWRALRHHH
jgi:hypothetical protein